jgi:hypothetical protein
LFVLQATPNPEVGRTGSGRRQIEVSVSSEHNLGDIKNSKNFFGAGYLFFLAA